jgi:hypothetical protein
VSDFTIKRCTKCDNEYPATPEYFNLAKFGKYGVSARCKSCDHEYYEANKGKIKQRTRDWYAANKERVNAERKAAYIPRPRQIVTTPERVKAQKKRYRDANPDKVRAATAKSKKKNPQARAAEKQRRRATAKGLPNAFTQSDWRSALSYFNNCCAVCGRQPGLWHTLAADHWIPVNDPRPDNPGTVPTNIVPLCHGHGGCNNAKASRDPMEWLVDKFGKRKAARIAKRIAAYFESLKG